MIPPTFDPTQFDGDVWLSADLHLGHKRILELAHRPWNNIDKHDNDLIKLACEVVKPSDLYVIVGDLSMAGPESHRKVMRYISRLPGIKVLVLGNHDELDPRWYVKMGIPIVATSLVLEGGVLVSHDPADAQAWPQDKPVICGHVHEFFKVKDNVVNVGVDVWSGYPVKLEEALGLCSERRGEQDWSRISNERHKIRQGGDGCDGIY
jgi:calcineurin-like phosphoesterase family protein